MSRRVEWTRRVSFAEVAEALDVPTTLVLLVETRGEIADAETAVAVYAESEDDPTDLRYVELGRGADGVLRATSVPVAMPGLWERIEAALDSGGRLD